MNKFEQVGGNQEESIGKEKNEAKEDKEIKMEDAILGGIRKGEDIKKFAKLFIDGKLTSEEKEELFLNHITPEGLVRTEIPHESEEYQKYLKSEAYARRTKLELEFFEAMKIAYEKRLQEVTDELEIKKIKSKLQDIEMDIKTASAEINK